jgi:hypothetical protein
MHAVANTPAELLAAFSTHFTNNNSLPSKIARSASASTFSGPAQRSLYGMNAHQVPYGTFCTRDSSRFHDCSSCYRQERKFPGGIRTHWKIAPLHGA